MLNIYILSLLFKDFIKVTLSVILFLSVTSQDMMQTSAYTTTTTQLTTFLTTLVPTTTPSSVPSGNCDFYDLIFMIDTSGSIEDIDSGNFERIKTFVRDYSSDLAVGPSKVQIGIVMFGNNGKLKVKLNQATSQNQLQGLIDSEVTFRNQRTNLTGAAIAAMDGFSTANGKRLGVPSVAVLVTDGEMTADDDLNVDGPMGQLKSLVDHFYVVTVDHYFTLGESERLRFQGFATNQQHYIELSNFVTLLQVESDIKANHGYDCLALANRGSAAGAMAGEIGISEMSLLQTFLMLIVYLYR